MTSLSPTLRIKDLVSLFGWDKETTSQWLTTHGVHSTYGVPLVSVMTADPDLWASVERRAQMLRKFGNGLSQHVQPTYSIGAISRLYGWSHRRVVRWLTRSNVRMIAKCNHKVVPLVALLEADPDLFHSALLQKHIESQKVHP